MGAEKNAVSLLDQKEADWPVMATWPTFHIIISIIKGTCNIPWSIVYLWIEKFLIECRKSSEIALVLLYFAL